MRQKRILVVRLGAYGDMIIITPFLRFLASLGQELVVLTQDQGFNEILPGNPHVAQLVHHQRDSVPGALLHDYLVALQDKFECDELIDLCESIEVNIALDPTDPRYTWTKQERFALCNRNYYEETFLFGARQIKSQRLRRAVEKAAGGPSESLRGELFFTREEEDALQDFRADGLGTYTILWGLSGSGRNKAYPWADPVMDKLLARHADIRIVTVGDKACQILEMGSDHPRLLRRSGVWSFRTSALVATRYCDLVVSPDTGLLHAAGTSAVDKVGLLGHTTRENITKHFLNDYSLEANAECAPCMRLILNGSVQCPLEPTTGAVWCMGMGLDPERVFEVIDGRINERAAGVGVGAESGALSGL